jgi:uncharacterized protein (DUF302 family)
MKLKFFEKKSSLAFFLCGLLWGIVITFVAMSLILKKFLILEYKSGFSVEETAEMLSQRAKDSGRWIAKRGSACSLPRPADGTKIETIFFCNAKIAKGIVDNPDSRIVTSVIPCQFSIYKKADGSVALSRLNITLIGMLSGRNAAELLTQAKKEQSEMFVGILE